MNTSTALLAATAASLLLLSAAPVRAGAPHAVEGPRSILATARAAGSFRTLEAAIGAAGLVGALEGPGPFTVFAPTDAAFAKRPAGTVESLLAPAGLETLRRVLTHHVVPGRVLAKDLLRVGQATTLAGTTVPFGLRVGEANVVKADVVCSNGVIHVIDAVLLPPAAAPVVPASHTAVHASPMAVVQAAIDRGVPMFNAGNVAGCVAEYEHAAKAIVSMPEAAVGPMARAGMANALASPAADARARAWALRRAFDRMIEDAEFQPHVEAPMPAGFPKPGPVDMVVMKEYPRYRAARAQGGGSFMTLFGHISRNKVEMTAPVEMTMDDGMDAMDMAFLYGSTDLGRTGRDGAVEVLDVPPVTVLSIGMRGEPNDESLRAAKAAIEARMRAEGLVQAGPWRRLGYNSPMVPNGRRFSEIQVPVRR